MTDTSYPLESDDPYCRWPEDAPVTIRTAPWRRVVAVGDSVAAGVREPLDGYRNLDGIARVAEVLRAAYPSFTYHNLGQRDLKVAEVRDSQLDRALDLRPDLVIVAAGGNDAFRRSFDDARFRQELTSLVAPLVTQGAQLVTIGLFDLPRSGLLPEPSAAAMAKRFDRLDALTQQIAIEHGGVHTQNHRHPLAADRSIFASDGIHANARGHAIAAASLMQALARLSGSGAPPEESVPSDRP